VSTPPVGDQPDEMPAVRSGLRNPAGTVRGMGSGTLILEIIVLLLAIQPLRLLGGGLGTGALVVVGVLGVVALVLTRFMQYGWAWWAGLGVQVALLGAGVLHGALGALGVIFGLVWAYLMHVRRTILR